MGVGASTCREAVELMVDAIVCACAEAEVGAHTHTNSGDNEEVVPLVRKGDIVRSVVVPFYHPHFFFFFS